MKRKNLVKLIILIIFIIGCVIGIKKIKNRKIEVIKLSQELDIKEEKNGLILVHKEGRYGYLDSENQEVFKPEWEDIEYFDDLDFVKAKKNNKITIFSRDGKTMLEKENVLDITPAKKNAFIVKNKKLRLENEKQEIISKEYDYIRFIEDDQYIVANLDKQKKLRFGIIEVVDEIEKILIEIKYEGITKINKKDFIIFRDNNFEVIQNIYEENPVKIEIDGNMVYFDSEKIISKYKDINGLHFFREHKKISYNYIGNFFYDLAIIKNNDKYGLIDKSGKIILKPEHNFLDIASQDLLIFKENDKYGYMDLEKNIVVPPIYEKVSKFFLERAIVILNGKKQIIDREGNIIKKAEYDDIIKIKDNVILGRSGEKIRVINSKDKEIIFSKYDSIDFWGSKYIKAILKKKHYIFDYEGNTLLKIPFEKKVAFYNNQINVENKVYLFEK